VSNSGVPRLVTELFTWAKKDKELHLLVKSSVIHYELEFIHPFEDGNGRIGRFWQTVLLYQYHPLFQFLPVESLIQKNQDEYYDVLERCDKKGDLTHFIEFMLGVILQSIEILPNQTTGVVVDSINRISQVMRNFGENGFTRKEYMRLFPTISSATASRDLKEGVRAGMFTRLGIGNKSKYMVRDNLDRKESIS
jgi:Fic family protein